MGFRRIPNKIIYFLAGLLFLMMFFYFTFVVKAKSLVAFDFNSTVRIQNHVPRSLDGILSLLSLLGSFEILLVVLFFALLSRKKVMGFIALFIFVAAHIIEIFGKSFLNHPGPPFQFFRYDFPFIFPSSYVQLGSSYPSGHSLRIVFVSIVFFYLVFKTKALSLGAKLSINLLIFMFMAAMLITRVSLGEHWPSDVIGGSFLGAGFGFISLLFL